MHGRSGANRFAWTYSGTVNPTTTPGVSITAGNGSKGTAVALASAANLANDVYGLWLNINTGSTTATARPIRLDIMQDPAGGTSYTKTLIPNILCGSSAAYATGLGYRYYFPIFIKAGTSIAARAQGIETGTLRVWAKFYGRPMDPLTPAGQWCETVGTPSGGGGVSLTPGNSSAEGSWVSLGTTTLACWWWQLSVTPNNGTITALMYHFDLAWGDGTNKTMIQENIPMFFPGTAETANFWNGQPGFADVPAGATLYVRGTCSGTAVTGFTALATGIGG